MKTVLNEKAHGVSQYNLLYIYATYVITTRESFILYCKQKISIDEFVDCIEKILKNEQTTEIFSKIDYFKVIRSNDIALDLFTPFIKVILKNIKMIQPDRIRELYHLFFAVIYSAKEPKFTAAEIDYLLGFDLRLITGVLIGTFDDALEWLRHIPDSEMKNIIEDKISRLCAVSK